MAIHTPAEPRPLPLDREARFLLATPLPDPPGLPDQLLDAFSGHTVVLLGWTDVPEQTSPEQVKDELGERAERALEELAERVRERDVEVETALAFTGDLVETLEERAREREIDILVHLRPGERVERILVPVPDPDMAHGLARYTAWVAGFFGSRVELLHPDREGFAGLRERFRAAGVPVADLHTTEGDADTADSVLESAADSDLVVLAESGPAEGEELLGPLTERVLRESVGPVMVVRLPRLFDADD